MSANFKDRKFLRKNPYELIMLTLCIALPVILFTVALAHVFPIDANELGDLFQGSVGVLFSLLSAILIYYSFQEQVEANKIIREEANFKYLLEESERINKIFEEKYILTIETTDSPLSLKGPKALKELSSRISQRSNGNGAYVSEYNAQWVSDALFYLKSYYLFLRETKELLLSNKNRKTLEPKICLYFDEYIAGSMDTFKQVDVKSMDSTDESQVEELKNLSIIISDLIDKFERLKNF